MGVRAYRLGLVAATLGLLLAACAPGPAAVAPSPPPSPVPPPAQPSPTPQPSPSPTVEVQPTDEPTQAPADTPAAVADPPVVTSPPRDPYDDGYGDRYEPGGGGAASPSAEATVSIAQSADYQAYLVGTDGMTLYIFTQDSPGASSCSGTCADAWPPLTLALGETPTAGTGVSGTLATIERDDGTWQVTYNDAPLYYFTADTAAGDTNGHEVGGVWFLAEP
jgi:predicted lipoprotein with Yx(FWY)xxD motif